MNENVDGHSPDWVEWIKNPKGVCCTKPKNVLAFTYNYESLKIKF